jgi:hypothetical protein
MLSQSSPEVVVSLPFIEEDILLPSSFSCLLILTRKIVKRFTSFSSTQKESLQEKNEVLGKVSVNNPLSKSKRKSMKRTMKE